MKTFKFNLDGHLVSYNSNSVTDAYKMLDMPSISSYVESFKKWTDALAVPEEYFVSPETYAGIRTATGYGQHLDQAVIIGQKVMNKLQNSILDIVKIRIDPYMPTIYKQFRFPRSKKKRIQKKWRKDKRNWKHVRVMFRIVNPKSFYQVDGYIKSVNGMNKHNAAVYGDL